MFRKLILASAVSLALLPGSSEALGLGGIRAESALNEPFLAAIELHEAAPDELDTVKVKLASPEEFAKVGAPRPHFLTQLRFNPQVSPQGQPVVQVTSREPIREPYLDFLVEIAWPTGRMIKEYTVLLDPPATTSRPAPRVERPAVRRPPPPSAAPAVAQARPAGAVPRDTAGYPLRYGPVKPGNGLWRIARAMAPPGATVAQTAMALYRNNQDAFIRGDINKLKLGADLAIPTPDELFALDTDAAEREFRTALSGGRATSSPLTDVTRAAQEADRLKIAAAPAAEAPSDEPPREAGAPQPELGAIKQELLLVQEAGESTRQETDELRSRIRELETQLGDIRKLLELRNEQLAQIQATVGADRQPAVEAPAGTLAEPEPEAGVEAAPVGESPPSAPAEAGEVKVPPPPPAAEVTEPTAQPPQPAEAPFWDSISPSLLGLAVGVPVLLLLLALLILRRRRHLEEEALPTTGFPEEPSPPAARAAPAPGAAEMGLPSAVGEGTLVTSELSAPYSSFGELEEGTGETDVISEADVYIAYGRYREAEALLSEEISGAPERMDLKLKLAEAYLGARNAESLEGLLDELRAGGAERRYPEQWQRLSSMAEELAGAAPSAPSPPRRAPIPEPAAVRPAAEPASGPPVDADSGLDFGSLLEGEGTSPRSAAPAPRSSVPASRPRAAEAPSASPAGEGLRLDLDDLGLADSQLRMPEEEVTVGGETSELEQRLEALGDLDSFRLDFEETQAAEPVTEDAVAKPSSAGLSLESLDIAPVGKDSIASDVLSSQWQMDSGLWDEVATKIDLARAYIEMEDPDAARVILEEVAAEGNDEQRAEAREMLSRLE
jgi:pilus assembly protein FimV